MLSIPLTPESFFSKSEPVFYGDLVYKFKELLESLSFVVNLKRLLNVIKERDTAWISCDSMHAWL